MQHRDDTIFSYNDASWRYKRYINSYNASQGHDQQFLTIVIWNKIIKKNSSQGDDQQFLATNKIGKNNCSQGRNQEFVVIVARSKIIKKILHKVESVA